MSSVHVAYAALFDHFARRASARVAAHLASCPACARTAAEVARVVAAGRRAATAPALTRKQRRIARRVFRDAHAPPRPSLLRLVLDSLTQPAPAVRGAPAAARFVRYEGAITVEMQITRAPRGVEVRGQVTPADHAARVEVEGAGRRRSVAIAGDGTFLLRLPHGETTFLFGATRIEKLRL